MNTAPTLSEWHSAKAPKIVTVRSLERMIAPEHYSHVYWIAKTNEANEVIESHPLKDWYFSAEGHLWGMVDTGTWKMAVEITSDEFVILNVAHD